MLPFSTINNKEIINGSVIKLSLKHKSLHMRKETILVSHQVGHKPAALFSHMQKSGFLMTGLISYLNIGLYVQQVEKKRQKDLATGDDKVQKTAKMCEGHVERKVSKDHVCKMSCVVRKYLRGFRPGPRPGPSGIGSYRRRQV